MHAHFAAPSRRPALRSDIRLPSDNPSACGGLLRCAAHGRRGGSIESDFLSPLRGLFMTTQSHGLRVCGLSTGRFEWLPILIDPGLVVGRIGLCRSATRAPNRPWIADGSL